MASLNHPNAHVCLWKESPHLLKQDDWISAVRLFPLAIFFFELLLPDKRGSSVRPNSCVFFITPKGRKAFPHMSWSHTHLWCTAGVHTASVLPSPSLKKKTKTQQQSPEQGRCMNDSKSAKTCCNPCLFTNVLNTSTAFTHETWDTLEWQSQKQATSMLQWPDVYFPVKAGGEQTNEKKKKNPTN